MKKYKVYITETKTSSTVVYAENKDEAELIADEYLAEHYEEIFPQDYEIYNYEAEEIQ